MKRIIMLGITLVLILICLGGCSSKTIDKPADTNLEFWITEDVTEFDFSSYYSVPGWFGASEYYGIDYEPAGFDEDNFPVEPEHCVKYKVTSYPDYSSKEQHITGIVITDPTITFYGITLESSDDDIIEAMTSNGYTHVQLEENSTYGNCLYFEQGNVTVKFYETEISIRAEVTNRFGIQF